MKTIRFKLKHAQRELAARERKRQKRRGATRRTKQKIGCREAWNSASYWEARRYKKDATIMIVFYH